MDNSHAVTPKGRRLSTYATIDSLRRHGFRNLSEVDDAIDNATRITTQRDGATVYIQRVGRRQRTYNVIIVGDRGIVTGLREMSPGELSRLSRNYGFDPNP
jgi:filamentous hemagglutinin